MNTDNPKVQSKFSFSLDRVFCCNTQTIEKKKPKKESKVAVAPALSRESSSESLEVTMEDE